MCFDIVEGRKNNKGTVRLLDNVSTVFENGAMSAIMGPSGAGKTTLLDIVSCTRKTRGEISGTVRFGSRDATKKTFKDNAAYVEQFDTLLPMLTVEETLYYWSEMQAKTQADAELKKERVSEILQHLNLTSCKDVIVGDALNRGISGGQGEEDKHRFGVGHGPRRVVFGRTDERIGLPIVRRGCEDSEKLSGYGRDGCGDDSLANAGCFSLF